MANDEKLIEAIQLIKAGQKDAARALLEPFLLNNPTHIQAWMWETELFSSDREKIKVLEACLKQNPGNSQVAQAMAFFTKRAGIEAQPVVPKPVQTSFAPPPPVNLEQAPAAYQSLESAKPVPSVSPFSGAIDIGESAAFMPESRAVESSPVRFDKPIRPEPLPELPKKAPAKKKTKPLTSAAKTAILVGLAVVACIALTGFYLGGGYYLNGQINDAFAIQNCAGVIEQSAFVSIYPQFIFGSMFNGHGQYAQCRSKLDMEQAVESKNWEQATSIAQGYLTTYPDGTFAPVFKEQAPKVLVAWASELIANHNYAAGIEKLQQLGKAYPDSPSAKTAPDTILQTYLSWAKGSSDKQEYKGAESTLNLALSYFKDDPTRSEQVKQELVNLYVAWGDSQVQLGDTDSAVTTYNKAGEIYPDSVDIDLLIARASLQKAVEISKTKNFNKALDKVKEILDSAQADNIKAEAGITRDNILNAYSESTSPQAVEQLTSAITLACQGQRPELPIFGLNAEKVRFGFTHGFVQLPMDLTPQTPGELHYVICITEKEETIETCKYTGNHKILRIRYIWETKLYDIVTGNVYDTENIKGVDPKACPPVAYLLNGSTNSKSYGQRPTSEQIVAWLTKLDLIK